jgi:alpha-beta hydrolase superfamily lysophospholipase
MNTNRFLTAAVIVAALAIPFAAIAAEGSAVPVTTAVNQVHYQKAKIDGIDVFYREAGPKNAPVVLLLHGFPTSSQMFRGLIPLLADKYHVIAPDYPGFGYSDMPRRLRRSFATFWLV